MSHIILQSEVYTSDTNHDYLDDNLIYIRRVGDTIEFKRKWHGQFVYAILDPAVHFKPQTGGALYWSEYGEWHYIDDHFESRDKDALMTFHYKAKGIVGVGWGDTPDEFAIVSYVPTVCDETDYHSYRNVSKRTADFIDTVIPGFGERRKKYVNARISAISEINPLDSSSDLEKQVDMLSTMVFMLMDAMPPENRPVWYDVFKEVVQTNASTVFKTSSQNIADIADTKRKIRNIQVKYFTGKA